MIILKWFLLIFLILSLILLLYFLFFSLLPTVKEESKVYDNPIFSDIELNYVIPREDSITESAKRAFVMCSADKEINDEFLKFNPGQSCVVASKVFDSGNKCLFSCLGLGDCVKSCPQEAIFIRNHTAVVSDLCVGCGLCIKSCPKGIIKMIKKDTDTHLVCSHTDSDLAGCSHNKKEENITSVEKKDFKLWKQCYKIIKRK
ncbi:MAG: 4Fe-4S binding protein [Clostridia bacterium]|nr:4Fe-4S binding protein [Clostridia bacterium]